MEVQRQASFFFFLNTSTKKPQKKHPVAGYIEVYVNNNVLCVGNYYYMTHWNDVVNRTAVLTVENAALANQGIYSASYVGDSPLQGAWMRLIVRG